MTDDNKNSKTNPNDWAKVAPAKRHALLQDISRRLRGCHKTDTVEVFGTWYTLRTIDPHESSWTLRYTLGSSLVAAGRSQRGPTIAAALVAVGETEDQMIPVEELFQIPDDLNETTREMIEASAEYEADWRRGEVLRWLSESAQHDDVVIMLYDAYLKIHIQRQEALQALSPLSKKTPTGASSVTSSPEKVSSSATPMSQK